MPKASYLPSILVVVACGMCAILPAFFLAGAPARSAVPHPTAQPAATIVPADPKNGYPAFSIQLGQNWRRSKPTTPDAAIGNLPSFTRHDPKTGKETASLSVMPIANPPKSLIGQTQSLFQLKKNGKSYMKLMHWGQFTAGLLYFPHFPDGSARLSASVVGPAVVTNIFAEYPKPVTSADKQEFVAIVKSFKLVSAK